MSNLALDKQYGEIMVKHLEPGDEAALNRFATALEEIGDGISRSKGRFWASMVGATAIRCAADYARAAATANGRENRGRAAVARLAHHAKRVGLI